MSDLKHPPLKKSNWRGFTLQLFLISVLPLTALLLVVAFGSQTLHHTAMRSLVGDRDLRTVRAASSSLERELSHLADTIQIISRSLNEQPDFSSLILTPEEISSIFDGGIALYSHTGRLIRSSTTQIDWQDVPSHVPEIFITIAENNIQPIFSTLISSAENSQSYIFIGILTDKQEVLLGAFSPDRLINNAISDLASSGQTTVMVISPAKTAGNYDMLYHSGLFEMDDNTSSHPGIMEALNGESGIIYSQGHEGEHVTAYNPISPPGWGLIIEETWEDIASPYLSTTQSAPLVIVPVFLLALLVIWFGARRIVTPLQKLEKQAASLATGDFDAIRQPVGGIKEIRNLQTELVEMADKLKAAQQSLRSYIGAITAGVENERRSLARELHDDTIQALIAFSLRIQMILMTSPKKQKVALSELQTLIQESMNNLRRMIRGLRPIYLEDLGVTASIEMLVHEMELAANIPIRFTSRGLKQRIAPQSEMSLYRMVQESLNNMIQHADAKHAQVEMEFTENGLSILIQDDGKGFVVPTNPAEFPEKGHFGLLGLHERAELINAKLSIVSRLGEGTTISIQLSNFSNQDHLLPS